MKRRKRNRKRRRKRKIKEIREKRNRKNRESYHKFTTFVAQEGYKSKDMNDCEETNDKAIKALIVFREISDTDNLFAPIGTIK